MEIKNLEHIKALVNNSETKLSIFSGTEKVSILEKVTLAACEVLDVPISVILVRLLIDSSFTDRLHTEEFNETDINELISHADSDEIGDLIAVACLVADEEGERLDTDELKRIIRIFKGGTENE